ncbi:MAG: alpha/beta hydrolase [Alphaproteobacteria bacterium]|nr:alpha/beta hydrolase [Alphaproteobacteria bacterium]
MKKGRGRFVIILLFAVAALAGLSAFWVPRYFEAAWFLEDVAAGPGDSTWKTLHKQPVRSAVTWTIDGRPGGGDLYTPAEAAKGRMVFVPGLIEEARTDPRVVAFAESLARAGFVTLVPQAAAFEDLRAGPSDIATISDAALWLDGADLGPAPKTAIGITALSYMAGPSIIAASRAPLAERIGFVFFIGGYYEATDVVRFVTTRKYRLKPGDPWQEQGPADYALWAFLKANALSLENGADRAALAAIAEARLKDGAADIAPLVAGLGPDGRAVYALIANRDPEKVEALIAALPAAMRARFDALDPSRQDLSGFKGEALLVHGKDDPLIASTESEKLAAALGGRAHLYLLEQVTHVEVNRPASMWDQLDLLFAGRRLLSYRE